MLRQFLTGGIAALALAIAAAGPAPAADQPKQGGDLVIITSEVPRHFNPAVQSGIATMMPGAQIFATLVRADADWHIEPYLALSWEISKDGLTATFHLRHDAKFSDGVPITSEDVKFSVEAQKKYHPFKTALGAVDTVETPDPYTAVFKLSHPHPALLLALSTVIVPIIPEHVYGKCADLPTCGRNTRDVVGSGPFKLVEYKPGESITLKRNPYYFLKGKPYLDHIYFRILKDASSRVIAMENGGGDIYPFIASASDILQLRRDKNLIVTPEGYAAIGPINWLAFNTKAKPLDDVRVRHAIAYAVDRTFITKALMRGVAKPATGPIVPGSPFYTSDVPLYDLDLDEANALLDKAGYKRGSDGTRFTLTVDYIPADPEQQKTVAEYLKPQLKKIGIAVDVRSSPDFPSWAHRISNFDFQMTMDEVYNWGDPVIGVARTYLCDNVKQGVIWSNTQQYCNPKVDALLNEAGQELDRDKRKALYDQFQKIVATDLPIYWINVQPMHTTYDKRLGNPPLSIWGTIAPLDDIYWKEPKS